MRQSAIIIFLSILLIASSSDKEEGQTITSGINQFSLTLTSQIDNGENVMISSLSIAMNLGLLANGARGDTQEQILNLFGCNKNLIDSLNRYFEKIIKSQTPDTINKLNIGNAIWPDSSIVLQENFVDFNKNTFNATVDKIDFTNTYNAVRVINTWAQLKTNDKIDKVFNPDELRGVLLVLANAIYFKGVWENQFDVAKTTKGVFHSESGDIQVSYMNKGLKVRRAYDEDYRIIELPFKGKRFSFLILMGNQDWLIADYISTLTEERVNSLIKQLLPEDVDISIPKFKMEFESDLNNYLKALGMRNAFSNNSADFSSMVESRGLYVEKVRHKTFIEVNEEGAEAAAVTATTMARSKNLIKVDRPFLFFIRDNSNGLFLFSGIMRNPKY